MNVNTAQYEVQLMQRLIKELASMNEQLRNAYSSGAVPGASGASISAPAYLKGSVPAPGILQTSIRLSDTIHTVLDECCFNIKSRGYTYIHDAVCIIAERGSMDICLNKEIYPVIAKKHGISGSSVTSVDHGIRNAIDSAYKRACSAESTGASLMSGFSSRPSSKRFILSLAQETNRRMMNIQLMSLDNNI